MHIRKYAAFTYILTIIRLMTIIRRFSRIIAFFLFFFTYRTNLAIAQINKRIPDQLSDKDLIDSALQSSQNLLYSPIVTIILYLSIIFILLGLIHHHGKTIAVSSFIAVTILIGRNFSDTIFTSFQVFQVSFIGPLFCLVLLSRLLSSYLKIKQTGEEESRLVKEGRQRYHQVQSRNTLRKNDQPNSQNSRVILNPISGATKKLSSNNHNSAGSKLTRPF